VALVPALRVSRAVDGRKLARRLGRETGALPGGVDGDLPPGAPPVVVASAGPGWGSPGTAGK
jgi:hypothetical protein